MRVPPSPISLSMFKDLGAAPMTLNAAEMYTALQTHLADGQENPLGTIEANKLYEVQKYCSHDQPHVGRLLGAGQRHGLEGHAGEAAGCGRRRVRCRGPLERADVEALNNSLVPRLEAQGMTFNHPDAARSGRRW